MLCGPRAVAWTRRFLVVVFPLYFVWELAQMPGYLPHAAGWPSIIARCGLATVGDTIMVAGLWSLGAVLFRDRRWFTPPRPGRYAVIVLAGTLVNMLVEWVAVDYLAVWRYRAWHPTVPPLDTGLLALVQPVILLPAVFTMLHRWPAEPHTRNG